MKSALCILVTPAKAGAHRWIPAFAGMTIEPS